MSGRLFLVATPIGNLNDLTFRAVEVLKAVRFIACEDTRHSRTLLDRYGVGTPTVSLPAFAEGERAGPLVARLVQGEDCALITDAGSPAVSDPGERLVAEALEAGVTVIPVPGPTALVAALSASGLPTGRFHFLGFLPRGEGDATAMIDEVAGLAATLVLYESPRRVVDTLGLLHRLLGDRRACVARELTKLHETFERGTVAELLTRLSASEVRGEVVILVEGRTEEPRWDAARVTAALEAGLARGEKLKALSKDLGREAGWSGQDVYRLGLSLKGN